MKLRWRRFDLPTRHTFTIARGSMDVSRTLVVELEHAGQHGYGEAGESGYYAATLDGMIAALEQQRAAIEAWDGDDPAALWQQLDPALGHQRFAQCALDMAAHDLWGKLRGQPVWKLWGLEAANLPPTDYTLGIDTVDVMLAKMREFPDWPIYKIKLGRGDDLAVVRQLRNHTSAAFRVDANCAWTVDQTLRNARELRDLGVEFIEQPLPPEDWDGMQALAGRTALPLVADESCREAADVQRCAACFQGVNIKLVKCGGLTPARRMALEARRLGLKVMVGCMCESTVGISGAAQLLPLLDYADLDGALLLAEDVATGVTIHQGRIEFPPTAGCGITLRAAQPSSPSS